MMPSIGIFDNMDINLIPFQANPSAGYAKGLMISGSCREDTVSLHLLVEWQDKTREKTTREYIALTVGPDGLMAPERSIDEAGE